MHGGYWTEQQRMPCGQVYYVVDKVNSFWWRGGIGYITKDMIKQHLPPPSDDSLILVRAAHWPGPCL